MELSVIESNYYLHKLILSKRWQANKDRESSNKLGYQTVRNKITTLNLDNMTIHLIGN